MTVPTYRVQHTPDLLALIPSMLGFTPTDSIVLCCARDGRLQLTARIDIPRNALEAERAIASVVTAILRAHADLVTVIAYHTGPRTNAIPVVNLACELLHATFGIGITAPVYVTPNQLTGEDTYYCLCGDAGDECIGRVPKAVELSLPGRWGSASRTRAECAASLEAGPRAARVGRILATYTEPVSPTDAEAAINALIDNPVDQLSDVAAARAAHVIRSSDAYRLLLVSGRPLTGHTSGDPFEGAPDRLRDNAVRIDRFAALAACLPDNLAGECLEVLAATAYLLGDGALGHMALDRAERHGLSRLGQRVRTLLENGLPPTEFMRS